jgi:hypothetical protein
MRNRIALAISIGVVVSVLLTALNAQIGDNPLSFFLLPGYFGIVLLWGYHGGGVPEFVSGAVMTGINAVVHALIAFVILKWSGR